MDINLSEIERILIINLASISEVCLSLPTTRALRAAYPDAKLTMLVVPYAAAIAEMNPYVDDCLVYDKRGADQGLSGLFNVISRVRKENFNLAICMNFSPRGAFVAWAAGIHYRIGYDKALVKLFLTHAADSDRSRVRHQTINNLQVLQPLAISTEDTSLNLVIDEKIERIIDTTIFMDNARPNIAFDPINSEHPARNPSPAKAIRLVKELEQFADVYLIGGLAEQRDLQLLAAAANLPNKRILAGRINLQELAALLKQMAVMLSVEAGSMYLAQAMNVPVVALFGPTNPHIYGPRGNHDIIMTQKLACQPCKKNHGCMDNRCVEEIPDEEIIANVCSRLYIHNSTKSSETLAF